MARALLRHVLDALLSPQPLKLLNFLGHAPHASSSRWRITYSEQLAIGYRWYDANAGCNCAVRAGRNACVAFPFGHGLSYTSFSVSAPRLTFDAASNSWRATVRVTNTGKRAGAQVVQVYLSLPPSANAIGAKQPPKRLVGFQRIELAPGDSGNVTVTIDPAASNHPLSVWNARERKWTVPAGRFKVLIDTSSAPGDLALAGTIRR